MTKTMLYTAPPKNTKNYLATILIIEDETDLRESIRDYLEFKGFEAQTASNGLEGIKKALEIKPDLIISDIMMPEKDGYEVIQEIRQMSELDMVPFIFLSAKYTPDDLRKGMNLMADDYIVKPFENKELLAVINARLDKITNVKKRFREINERLVERQKQLREYSFITSHHIRGPLCNVLGLVELMQDDEDLARNPLLNMLKKAAQQLDTEIRKANEILANRPQKINSLREPQTER